MLLGCPTLRSQPRPDSLGLYLEFPVLDWPYQRLARQTTGSFLSGYANPSMAQSLALSNGFYSAAHDGISRLIRPASEFRRILFCNAAAAAFDAFSFYLPLGYGWLHEEYHRAVLTRRGADSFNEMNTFPFGQDLVAVRNVRDEDLMGLADAHAPDFVRLMAAGLEGQYHQVQTLQQQNFYFAQDLPHIPLYWLSTFTNIIYVNQSGSDFFDDKIDEANAREGADVARRDFTGPDFTAWADKLFFPDRPYAARGLHPSGVGIDRYVRAADLSPEARAYLQKQGRRQWFNVLSPHLYGFARLRLARTSRGDYFGNFAVRHVLTSFGESLSINLFYQSPRYNVFVSSHRYANGERAFPGLEVAVLEYGCGPRWWLTGRALGWLQPRGQAFDARQATAGGLLGLRARYRTDTVFTPYAQVEGKTAGWVMGHVFLAQNLSLQVGAVVAGW